MPGSLNPIPLHDMLLIVRCLDPRMWYAGMIGRCVPYLGEWQESYRSREPDGFINIVRKEDAVRVA